MHQLPEKVGADPSRLLDARRLANKLRALLRADPDTPDDLGLRLHSKGLAAVQADRSRSLARRGSP
jgi:hypothetical protein